MFLSPPFVDGKNRRSLRYPGFSSIIKNCYPDPMGFLCAFLAVEAGVYINIG